MNIIIKIASAILIGFGVSGCETSPGSESDVHTGVTIYYSSKYNAASGLLSNLNVQAGGGLVNGQMKYGVGTAFLSTGLGWSFFKTAHSFGKQYPFKATNEKLLGCSGGSCSHLEEGFITMTKSEFANAAGKGFEFKLSGTNRSVIGKIPASVFAEAVAEMNSASVW